MGLPLGSDPHSPGQVHFVVPFASGGRGGGALPAAWTAMGIHGLIQGSQQQEKRCSWWVGCNSNVTINFYDGSKK